MHGWTLAVRFHCDVILFRISTKNQHTYPTARTRQIPRGKLGSPAVRGRTVGHYGIQFRRGVLRRGRESQKRDEPRRQAQDSRGDSEGNLIGRNMPGVRERQSREDSVGLGRKADEDLLQVRRVRPRMDREETEVAGGCFRMGGGFARTGFPTTRRRLSQSLHTLRLRYFGLWESGQGMGLRIARRRSAHHSEA